MAEDIAGFMALGDLSPIYFSEVEDKEGINRAIDCAVVMRRDRIYRGQKIGVINPDIPKNFGIGFFRRGQVILYRDVDVEDGTATVDTPYTLEAIAEQRTEGSLLSTHTTINVPLNHIRQLVAS